MKSRFLGMLSACALGLTSLTGPTAQAISFQEIPGFGYGWSDPEGVSADGSVVVGTGRVGTHFTGYRWTEATGPVDLGCQSGLGVSADGNVAVGETGAMQAFVWTEATGCVVGRSAR